MGEKSPLIIAIALTVFGWYIDSISKYFSETPIVYVSNTIGNDEDVYVLKNVSINKGVERLAVQVQCAPISKCLKPAGKDGRFGTIEQIAPFAASSNQSCFQNGESYQAQISLPPAASARIRVNKNSNAKTQLFVTGRYNENCSNILEASVRMETYPSAIAFLLENFFLYYVSSIIVLLLVFVITVVKLVVPGVSKPGEDNGDDPQHIAIDLTIHPAPTSDAVPRR
jgi:hypothetical protein